jgi:hypothetical protein
VVTCLPNPSSDPAEDDIFQSNKNLCSTTFFGWEVKPSVPCHKILRHVKDSYGHERDTL